MLKKIAFLLIVLGLHMAVAAQTDSRYPLIPYPQQLTPQKGSFLISSNTKIVADPNVLSNELQQLTAITGKNLTVVSKRPDVNFIEFKLDNSIEKEEGYRLEINPKSILLTARTTTGIFRGIETIRQLAPASLEVNKKTATIPLPCVSINDFPVYAYRGMHIDVSRHFFTLDYLKKYVDRLAMYKFNKLHLHLTDDQGWRIEIKKYPLLTEKGAWRTFNNQDSSCMKIARETQNPDMELDPRFIKTINGEIKYGGFYTQNEMRDLVKYAAARHIDIIPEIDMPGHMDAAIQAYPFLSCTEGGWKGGPFTVPICPCKESTFEFAENVFKEIFDIFPYEYVHLGADEVNKESWKRFDGCKELMERENLKNYDELQSYFVRRMEKFFNANNKKLIGWDEILEGGISPTAHVMYWRSWVPKAPVEAAKNGNKVIMTPGEPLYFDAHPDKNSLYNVYHFNPIPKGLTKEEAENIIGAQANIWTETVPTEGRLEYLTLPRMLALPEVLWTNKQDDFNGFQNRLNSQLDRLDLLKTKYRLPDIEGLIDENVFVQTASFFPQPPAKGLVLRYTTDGQAPTIASPIVSKPIIINKTTQIKIAAFKKQLRGDVYTVQYKQQNLLPAKNTNSQGMTLSVFNGNFTKTADLDQRKPDSVMQWQGVKTLERKGEFGLIYKGIINVPKDGVYSFFLTADDGAILKIDDEMVVDNDGLHSAKEKSGQIALKKGAHDLVIKFIEGGGGYTLRLEMMEPGSNEKKPVPDNWF